MDKGLVIRTTGSSCTVFTDEGLTRECHIKGNFRIRGIRSTNPIAVGDRVTVETQPDGTTWIADIDDRRNYIVRRSTNLSKETHILAANLDRAILLVTLRNPETSTTFIDRFLATAEAYRVPAILVFNKIDLLTTPEQQAQLSDLRTLYESLGYPTYAICANRIDDPAALPLLDQLRGRITLLSGNSGVGKSTLLNALLGREVTRTGQISAAHHKGMHTTTFSEMYPFLEEGTWIIDTPGIKGFGAVRMEREEVSHYFREIFRIGRDCRYSNCLHTGEPGCEVFQAACRGDIAASRMDSYLSMLGDCNEAKYR
ncbi:MAG: ribosome small subunit-dependent GTPase A [Paludibacteraceae bacterium]|nr:ribosome small subunit-dependent GTPase A [Paludibacteraceae bacterium]MBR1480878.1 ribosome small subunit-dependent GTPase A [Paludibacteraceae bacterium]